MMKKIIFIVLSLCANLQFVASQSVRAVLWDSVRSHNPMLQVAIKEDRAHYYEAHTGITLSDPTVELGYLWDAAENGADKRILNVEQEFDLSVISGRKRSVAEQQYALSSIKSVRLERELHYQFSTLSDRLVKLMRLLSFKRVIMNNVSQSLSLTEKSFRLGECNKLDVNRVRMLWTKVRMEYKRDSLDAQELIRQLVALGGEGNLDAIDWEAFDYDKRPVPLDFEEWFQSNVDSIPTLLQSKCDGSLAEGQVRLAKSLWWPKFSLAYQSEVSTEERLHGANVTLSLPLWENKNQVKSAQMRSSVSQEEYAAVYYRLHEKYSQLYQKMLSVYELYKEFGGMAASADESERLLQKVFQAGEISLGEYLVEMNDLIEVRTNGVEMEYEYQSLKTELFSAVED